MSLIQAVMLTRQSIRCSGVLSRLSRPHVARGVSFEASFLRKASTLVILEARDGNLSADALSAIAAATRVKGPVTGLIVSNNISKETPAAHEASKFKELAGVLIPKSAASGDYVSRPLLSTSRASCLTFAATSTLR